MHIYIDIFICIFPQVTAFPTTFGTTYYYYYCYYYKPLPPTPPQTTTSRMDARACCSKQHRAGSKLTSLLTKLVLRFCFSCSIGAYCFVCTYLHGEYLKVGASLKETPLDTDPIFLVLVFFCPRSLRQHHHHHHTTREP